MKKINLLVIALVAAFGFTVSASAADSVSMTCTKKNISIGETANCQVTMNTSSPKVNLATIQFDLDNSETIDISDITPNTSAGWARSSSTAAGTYVFQNAAGVTAGKSQIFSFNVTLNDKAKNLGADDNCGRLCIIAAKFDEGNVTGITEGEGTCFIPKLVEDKCVGEDCNPKTGAFANIAAIVGVAFVALGAIVIAKRSSKFYRI